MIPPVEIITLNLTIAASDELAHAGEAAEGYECLSGAFRRAAGAGRWEPRWAATLESLWQSALDGYAARHGVRPS
jgi:hypothetical protein